MVNQFELRIRQVTEFWKFLELLNQQAWWFESFDTREYKYLDKFLALPHKCSGNFNPSYRKLESNNHHRSLLLGGDTTDWMLCGSLGCCLELSPLSPVCEFSTCHTPVMLLATHLSFLSYLSKMTQMLPQAMVFCNLSTLLSRLKMPQQFSTNTIKIMKL